MSCAAPQAAAAFTAIFHVFPAGSPFFAPAKWSLTNNTDFFGQMGLEMGHINTSGNFTTKCRSAIVKSL
jgi:hypothetical protein